MINEQKNFKVDDQKNCSNSRTNVDHEMKPVDNNIIQ